MKKLKEAVYISLFTKFMIGLVSLFYGISTFMGYLMPKLS